MKYRIKKETTISFSGNKTIIYYPQHKHWWSIFWHYFGQRDDFGDYVHFISLKDAKHYIEWHISKNYMEDYIYV